ncbi:MAG: YhdP family protein [Gammaproteobacteria bacterium]|nr:MAG: YhdP family protein [Gammaproteobacteria bacterium]
MKTVGRTFQIVIAVLVVVVGLGAASVRVLFPNADRYRGDLESWLVQVVGQPVTIGSLEAKWRGWGPEFRINDLKLRDPTQRGKDGGINARFESATITVDVLASLLGGVLRPTRIQVSDVSLRVNRAAGAVGPDAAFEQHRLALLDWLLSQQRLTLDATRVEFSDLRVAGEPITLTNLRLAVRNRRVSHVFEVAAQIPGVRNGAISASATLNGDPASSHWSGDIAVNVDELNVATLKAWRYRLGDTDVAGRVSLRLDSRWREGTLVEANGDMSVSDMRIASAGGILGPLNAGVLVRVTGGEGDWRARLLPPGAGILSFREPAPLASVRYTRAASGPGARLSASIAELEIADLVPILPIALRTSAEVWQQIVAAAPSGRIRDLAITIEGDAQGIRDVRAAGDFRDVGSRSTAQLPALAGVNGDFDYDARGTRVRLAGGSVRASLPDLFPEPLTGNKLRGQLSWSDGDGERRLTLSDLGFVTPDVTVRSSGELLWQKDDSVPFVDLSIGFSDGDLARLEYFVPTGMFGKKTGAWLDQAFPRGRLTAATIALRGRPPREMQDDSDFSVTVNATVRDTSVHYLDGWPSVERVAGTLRIAERKLVAKISDGYFFDARIRPSRFVIADIQGGNPVFDWSTRIDGNTEDALRYLRESPLRERFRSLLDNVDAKGSARLALSLQVPLARGEPRITGTIDVSGNTLSVPSLRKGFTEVAGRVRFDQDGMGGEGVTGNYLGRTVTAAIETVGDRAGHTRMRLAGSADAAYIARHLFNAGLLASPEIGAMPILTRLDGSAPWEATIDVFETADSGEAPVVLRVESNLRGAALTLPEPFEKSADASMNLVVEARFADAGDRRMQLTLGAWASGVFDLRAGDAGYRLSRGAVRLGGGPATLPDESRLSVSGRMPRADVGEWSAIVMNPPDGSAGGDALPVSVDVRVDRLAMLGAEFADVRLQASSNPTGSWRTAITGPDVDGKVLIPAQRPRQPIVAKFERLVMTPAAGDDANADADADADATDPRQLPPVRFTCVYCRYGDMQFYDVEVITSRRSDGLSIDSLRLRNDGFEAQANGAWTRDQDGAQRTRLDVRLRSDDLGKFLISLGQKGGATRGGATDVTLAASWDGPPSNFDLQKLDGVLNFRAGQGILTEVRRGTTGRLFGLLAVPDLPRRLKGDFNDLFESGFAYKQIEGTFNIERGNAYTNDLTLDGSVARIDIAGRTGLVDEDYDQVITVTPKLSESLPLVPIWLVEKAFRREVFNKLFSYQYTITGSWDQPLVKRIVIEKDFASDRS